MSWQIRDEGDSLDINLSGVCDPLTAKVSSSGTSASLNPKSCPQSSNQGTTFTPSITGGTFNLDGDTLAVAVDMKLVASGEVSGTCTTKTTGTLTRQSQ